MSKKPSSTSNLDKLTANEDEVRKLKTEVEMLQLVFQLFSNATFPGQQCGNVLEVLKWIDAKHTPLHKRLVELTPSEPKPLEANA